MERLFCALTDACQRTEARLDALQYAQGSLSRLDFVSVLLAILLAFLVFVGMYAFGAQRGIVKERAEAVARETAEDKLSKYLIEFDKKLERMERMAATGASTAETGSQNLTAKEISADRD